MFGSLQFSLSNAMYCYVAYMGILRNKCTYDMCEGGYRRHRYEQRTLIMSASRRLFCTVSSHRYEKYYCKCKNTNTDTTAYVKL